MRNDPRSSAAREDDPGPNTRNEDPMIELDHTIVCTSDAPATVAFYRDVLGFDYAGRSGRFEVVKVNDHLALDFAESEQCRSRHFAYSMDSATFTAVFERLRESGTSYGDGPGRVDNMRGPGRSTGVKGVTYSVYFRDPNGHVLEIISYDDPGAESMASHE